MALRLYTKSENYIGNKSTFHGKDGIVQTGSYFLDTLMYMFMPTTILEPAPYVCDVSRKFIKACTQVTNDLVQGRLGTEVISRKGTLLRLREIGHRSPDGR